MDVSQASWGISLVIVLFDYGHELFVRSPIIDFRKMVSTAIIDKNIRNIYLTDKNIEDISQSFLPVCVCVCVCVCV